ncbi:MAG: hypothetical protein M3021_10385 [Actinomycetota bacterium]|uniref:hypothetical protein n=1 Tax=Paenarthrobacter sp. PH39-S1 TaxID=3046204 RepID=UPI0024B9FDF4|nr:hypothetical protein [Paenarthrobacter sp. PH39-S1]MDJ0354961.1 hypothetical protein [Paenarthrobacter sp. PH39-S1]MDQ6740742.1 hypothetical protein [Actinomycetota bacterium]
MEKLTVTELEGQSVELLPSRETLLLNFHINWASVMATNASYAVNAVSLGSSATSGAWQTISVSQH